VREIELRFGEFVYRILSEHPGSYHVTRQLIVHGVSVGNIERLPSGSWVDILCQDLASYAQSEGLSAESLERLIIGP
jgi:hypothetical protein